MNPWKVVMAFALAGLAVVALVGRLADSWIAVGVALAVVIAAVAILVAVFLVWGFSLFVQRGREG